LGQAEEQKLAGVSDPGPIFDFDGDGKVSRGEIYLYENWLRDSGLLERGLQEAPRYSDGTVDLASFLRTLPTASVEGTRTLESESCDQGWICCFIRGDVNRDWDVNMADVMALLEYLPGGEPPPNIDAADVNDDGRINYADCTYLLSYLFSGGTPPPAPFPGPGIDPTYDPIELPCQDAGDFEHAPNALEKRSVAVPPKEVPHEVRGLLPSNLLEPVDGTGALGSIAPELETFPGPGGLKWGVFPSYRARYVDRQNEACAVAFESELGANWFSGIPHVVDAGPNASPRYWVRWSASWVRAYDGLAGGPYFGRFDNDTKLVEVAEGNEKYLVLYDLAGRKYVFFGYEPESRGAKGRLARIEAPGRCRGRPELA